MSRTIVSPDVSSLRESVTQRPIGVLISIGVTPKASTEGIASGDGASIRLRVTQAPEGGKTNRRVLELLASAVGRPNPHSRS